MFEEIEKLQDQLAEVNAMFAILLSSDFMNQIPVVVKDYLKKMAVIVDDATQLSQCLDERENQVAEFIEK